MGGRLTMMSVSFATTKPSFLNFIVVAKGKNRLIWDANDRYQFSIKTIKISYYSDNSCFYWIHVLLQDKCNG